MNCVTYQKGAISMDPMILMLVFLVIMMVPMWLMSRGQRKRMAQQQELVKSLGIGDEVRTHSGFYGMIVEEDAETVVLETEDGSQLKWNRNAIAERVQTFADSGEVAESTISSSEFGGPSDAKRADFLAGDSRDTQR